MPTVGLCAGDPPETFWIAQITHSFENGHHIFTSKTKHISGLFIADKDAIKALNQIAPAIQRLVWHNLAQKVRVTLGTDFDEFRREHADPASMPIKNTIAVIQEAA